MDEVARIEEVDDSDLHPGRIPEIVEPFRVEPGSEVRLAKDFDPGFKAGIRAITLLNAVVGLRQ